MINIGLLKLDLLLKGIRPVADWPEDMILVLPENTWVMSSPDINSPYEIKKNSQKYELVFSGTSLPIKPIFPPAANQKKTSSGYLVGELLHSHGGFIAAAPRGPCRFARSGFACKYCGTKKPMVRTDYTNQDFVEALQILLSEVPAEIIHLSSGFIESEDGGMALLEPLIQEIRKHLNILISVDVMPPATNHWIDRTYAAGVDMVYYDIDVFDPVLFAATFPEKQQKIRRDRYFEALKHAVKVFPQGAVTSHLVLGLESLESTRKGIDALTSMGVLPLLTFFPPQPGTKLATDWTPNLKQIVPLYAYLFQKIQENKLSTNWIRQIDVVLTPLEARHFAGGKTRIQVAVKNFYHTAIGRKAAVGLSALRRKFRVR